MTHVEADALVVAAEAASAIVSRALLGGTDAITYESVRDEIIKAVLPMLKIYDDAIMEARVEEGK